MIKLCNNMFFVWKKFWCLNKRMNMLWAIGLLIEVCGPFITIVFPSFILNELVSLKRIELISMYIFWMILCYAISQIILHIVQHFIIMEDMKIGNAFGSDCTYKQMTMAYQNCEKNEVMNKLYQFYFQVQPANFFRVIGSCLRSLMQITVCIGIYGRIDGIILLVLVGFLMIQNIIINKAKKHEYDHNKEKTIFERKMEYLGRVATEYEFAKDLRIYNGKEWLIDKSQKVLNKYSISFFKYVKKQYQPSLGLVICDVLQQGMFYIYFSFGIISGRVLLGSFNLLLATASQFQNSISMFLNSLKEVRQLSKYIELYREYLLLVENEDDKGKDTLNEASITLEFQDVSFTYPGTEKAVLEHVSFKVHHGSNVAIVGANGSGKTTLVKLICRLYRPTEGQILLNGKDIFQYHIEDYVKYLSVLLQDYKLLAFSIRENIVLNKDEEEENILACIEKSGLGDKVRSLKQGLETVLYKDFSPNGIELSGGENQKLVLAREIYKNGLFFILDEPTASLDPIAEFDFYEGLRNLAGSQTCLYISHRLYSVKAANFIIVMNEGKVCEIGTHDYLMKIKGLYYDMFSKQASLYIVGGCNE